MRAYIDICDYEISGMGKVERLDDGSFMVVDVRILEQEVNSASSDMDTTALARFQVELIQAGESPLQWVCWWHSHAKMSVFWSAKDNSCIDNSTEFPYLLSVVANKKEDILARVDVYTPVRMTANLEVEVMSTQDTALYDVCRNDITMKVREEKKWSLPTTYSHSGVQPSLLPEKKSKKQLKREAKEREKNAQGGAEWVRSFGFGSQKKSIDIESEDEGQEVSAIAIAEFYDERDELLEELTDARISGNIENEAIALDLLLELAGKATKLGIARSEVESLYSDVPLLDDGYDYQSKNNTYGKYVQTANGDF